MFDVKKLDKKLNKNTRNGQKLFIVAASAATLVATGDFGSAPKSSLFNGTEGDDVITVGADAGIVIARAGNDKVTGGAGIDLIWGGLGVDDVNGGAGVDHLVVVGITVDGAYSEADLLNIRGTGANLSSLLDLAGMNGHSVSDVQAGESIDGGADGAILYTFGAVDFGGVTLANISKIYLDNQVTLTNSALQALKGQGLTSLLGTGVIKAASGLLDLDGVSVPAGVTIQDSNGNVIVPTAAAGSIGSSVNVAENSTNVGSFMVTDASAVGTVTYTLGGADAALFDIDSVTGAISFKDAPDFEAAQDAGADNIYDVTVTATDEHQQSLSQNIAINVTDVTNEDANASTGGSTGSSGGGAGGGAGGGGAGGGGSSNAPLAGGVTITGDAHVGVTLTASNNITDADGLGGGITYQWQKDGSDIGGATSATYVVQTGDLGGVITAIASYTDGGGTDESATSAATGAVILAPLAQVGSSILLSGLSAANQGAQFKGVTLSDQSGSAVANLGDINGDGYDDFIIGGRLADPHGAQSGSAYVVFGKDGLYDPETELSSLNGTNGFKLNGIAGNDRFGNAASAIGDINGDGYDDFIVGAPGASNIGVGKAYVIYGTNDFSSSLTSGVFEASDLNGSNGFSIAGVATQGQFGLRVGGGSDLNGDGLDDFMISAPNADPNSPTNNTGSVYVIYGDVNAGNVATYDITTLDGSTGFRADGGAVANSFLGAGGATSVGDVNGDGYGDMIVGSPYNGTAGQAHILFGGIGGFGATLNITDSDFVIATTGGDRLGTVSAAGDVNGDGFDDYIIGAFNANNGGGVSSGAAYVMFGNAGMAIDGFVALAINPLDGTDGFRIDGDGVNSKLGFVVSNAGDINGDGYADLIVGADGNNGNVGASYIIYGKASFSATPTFNVNTLDGSNGFKVVGAANGDKLGYSASAAGDVNGDGYDDLLIGAYEADNTGAADSGTSYILYGGTHFSSTATSGTVGDNNVTGSAADNELVGGRGNDNLRGLAGKDVLIGGIGGDRLEGGVDFDKMIGGGGADKFVFNIGDSVVTVSSLGAGLGQINGFDVIEDFEVGDGTHNSETFEIVGATSIAGAGVFDGVDGAYKVGGTSGSFINAHSVTNGVITFDDNDVFNAASTLTLSTPRDIAAVVQYLQANDFGDQGATLVFDMGSDTFIFVQGDNDGASIAGVDNDKDILVRLEDVQVDSLITTIGTGAFDLFIA